MRKRSKSKHIDNIDGVLGALSYKAIKERQEKEEKEEIKEPERTPYNCPNCCAPITKPYCEYCGTHFGFTVVKVNSVPKKEEIERIKSRLYADDLIVYEAFEEFHEVAHDLPPKLPIKKQR